MSRRVGAGGGASAAVFLLSATISTKRLTAAGFMSFRTRLHVVLIPEVTQMRLELCRSHLEILPEGEADLAYIEDTLGLRKAGNQIPLIRLDYAGRRATLIRLAAGSLRLSQPRRRKHPAGEKD
jgi:hypothetical protein